MVSITPGPTGPRPESGGQVPGRIEVESPQGDLGFGPHRPPYGYSPVSVQPPIVLFWTDP